MTWIALNNGDRRLLRTAVIFAAVGLSACQAGSQDSNANTASGTSASDVQIEDTGVKAFRDICLRSAPDFGKAAEYAKQYGIAKLMDMQFSITGMTEDNSLSVQVKPGKECAITTPNRPGKSVKSQFNKVLQAATGSSGSKQGFPRIEKLNGTPFIFMHDRKGGEAYVMLKK